MESGFGQQSGAMQRFSPSTVSIGNQIPPAPRVSFQAQLADVLLRLRGIDQLLYGFQQAITEGPRLEKAVEAVPPGNLTQIIQEIDETVLRIKNTAEHIVSTVGG